MIDGPFAPIRGLRRKPTTATPTTWTLVVPVPDDAPPAPAQHPTLGRAIGTCRYLDAAGRLLGYVRRFDTAEGKAFRPLTLWRPTAGGKAEWRWESWPAPRPLYGLRGLTERPSAPVVVCEGEKAADAAQRLLPSFVAVTSPNGSRSAGKADWSPLRGRRVIVWPDADEAGIAYAHAVAKQGARAGALEVAIISTPPSCAAGWDAADALEQGWTAERASELIAAAVLVDEITVEKSGDASEQSASNGDGGRRRTPQRDVVIGLCESVELWHDADRAAYATFVVNEHHEHWPIRSRDFRIWLSGEFYKNTGAAIGGQALEDGLRILEARAVNEGLCYECFIRMGHATGKMFIDLGGPSWNAVEITATGWRVIKTAPLKFLRSPSMRALPVPKAGSLIEELRRFLNVKDDGDFLLVVAWLVAALRDRGPFPILVINGEAGAGKSVFSRMLRLLVDPSAALIRAMSRDDRDLVVSASNSWVLSFDNLSRMPDWFADALCRLATGSGYATRMLHTDRSEMIFDAARPIIINGIPNLTDRADLADRSMTIHLRSIREEESRGEDKLWPDFEQARPYIFGALLDAVSRALGNIDDVKLDRVPRMADFAKWITAAEPGLGWEPDEFITAYSENREDVADAAFEADSVAVAIDNLITTERPDGFGGTATDLLAAINNMVPEGIPKSKYWPQTAAQLGNRFVRAMPLLKARGYAVERRHSGERTITVVPAKKS
jgi:putative DNA primase/helicase